MCAPRLLAPRRRNSWETRSETDERSWRHLGHKPCSLARPTSWAARRRRRAAQEVGRAREQGLCPRCRHERSSVSLRVSQEFRRRGASKRGAHMPSHHGIVQPCGALQSYCSVEHHLALVKMPAFFSPIVIMNHDRESQIADDFQSDFVTLSLSERENERKS